MKKTCYYMVCVVLWGLLLTPLMANKGCGDSFKEAEQKPAPAAHPDKELPVLPNGKAGEALLKSGGPEVSSPPVETQ